MKTTAELKYKCGVYEIVCDVNDRSYIGETLDLRERYNQHTRALNDKEHNNKELQADYDKYGKQHFVFKVLYICDPKYRKKWERWYIRQAKNELYNPPSKNASGFWRVHQYNNQWIYQYSKNYRAHKIICDDIFELKHKVEEVGLEWEIVDINKATETMKEIYRLPQPKGENNLPICNLF